MTPGQTSDALRAKLKQVGERLTDEQIGQCYARVESTRRKFTADVVRLGVMLLAKKQTLAHGKWRPWVLKMSKSADSALLALPPILQEKSHRSCEVYMQVGKHFLADLEQGSFAQEGEARLKKPACEAAEIVLLPDLPAQRQTAVEAEIERFVAGRSLDRMLMDFRRAEDAADQEELAQAAAARKKSRKKGAEDANQMDFWTDLQRPLTEIETYCETPSVLKHADKAFWEQLATALETQAKRARARAKEMAS